MPIGRLRSYWVKPKQVRQGQAVVSGNPMRALENGSLGILLSGVCYICYIRDNRYGKSVERGRFRYSRGAAPATPAAFATTVTSPGRVVVRPTG